MIQPKRPTWANTALFFHDIVKVDFKLENQTGSMGSYEALKIKFENHDKQSGDITLFSPTNQKIMLSPVSGKRGLKIEVALGGYPVRGRKKEKESKAGPEEPAKGDKP